MNNCFTKLTPPHGGKLIPLLVSETELQEQQRKALTLKAIRMNSRETSDVIMMAMGAFSPLRGFVTSRDYKEIVERMQLSDGTFWPIPITLSVQDDEARLIKEGEEVALWDRETNTLIGTMLVEEKFNYDKKKEATEVYRTTDQAHPGVAKLYTQGEILLGGTIKVFSELDYPERFGNFYAKPAETRQIFAEKGWKTIAAFQTRNPIHRSHEYCTKIALEITDGLFIHPLVGKLKEGDIPADVRMRCYEVLLDKYYPKDRVVLKVYPMEMRYAGPREAVLHAIIRQNFGCSHLIIGRDHAGVGKYYGPFDAQKIFDEIPDGKLLIQPLKIDLTFWCHECQSMASTKTCPHPESSRLIISGTELRNLLARGEMPPEGFSRPEVLAILRQYYNKISG